MGELHQNADEGAAPGGELRVVLARHRTGGAFSLVTLTLPPFCSGDAPHRHRAHLEAWYVLEGALAATVGDRTVMLGAGEAALVPPGILHACWNPTARPTTVLLVAAPGCDDDPLATPAHTFDSHP